MQRLFENILGGKEHKPEVPLEAPDLLNALRNQLELQRHAPLTLTKVLNLVLEPESYRQWTENPQWKLWLSKAAMSVGKELELDAAIDPEINLVEDSDASSPFQLLLTHKSMENDSTAVLLLEDEAAIAGEGVNPEFILPDNSRVELTSATISIGRAETNDLIIADMRVSREHAILRNTENGFVLLDLNATGGTYVNGQRVQQTILRSADVVSFGGYQVIFLADTTSPHHLGYRGKTDTTLIEKGDA